MAERERLRHLEALRARGADRRRGGRRATPARRPCWPRPRRRSTRAAGVDAELDALAERLRALRLEAEDLAGDLRRYEEAVEAPPGRLEEVEDRLAAFDAPDAQARRQRRGGAGARAALPERRDELSTQSRRWRTRRPAWTRRAPSSTTQAAALREARRARRAQARRRGARAPGRAGDGGRDVRDRARAPATGPAPPAPTPSSSCIATNPGVPAGAGARDRLGRRALAGHAGAAQRRATTAARRRRSSSTRSTPASAARPPGRWASACARWPRAVRSCASPTCRRSRRWPTRHFRIAKDTTASRRAHDRVGARRRDELVGELVRMLGADEDDVAARRHARELSSAA